MYNKFASRLLDEMENKLAKAENDFQKKIIKQFIKILENYVK